MVLAPIPEPKIRLFPSCFEMSLIGGRAVRCKLFIKLRETVRASVFDPRSMREKVLAKKAARFRWLEKLCINTDVASNDARRSHGKDRSAWWSRYRQSEQENRLRSCRSRTGQQIR